MSVCAGGGEYGFDWAIGGAGNAGGLAGTAGRSHGEVWGGIALLVNQKTFGFSRDIWAVLDRLRHPAVGSCWDVLTAAVMGERPGVSVPTLNSRIRMVRVGDALIGDGIAVGCAIGDGDVAVEQFLKRLRGIGYGGYVVVELPGDREMLTVSAKKLRGWWGEGAISRRTAKHFTEK